MLTINAPIFDIEGCELIEFPGRDGITGFNRRNSRIPTLDGSAAINDFGYADADRTLDIEWTPRTQDQIDNIVRMVKSYSRLIVSNREGCFIGAPGSLSVSDGTVQLQILVERRMDQ